ncbi:MAG: hypothetical protein QME07_00435 [bacterium]|nr:hypothetical protein [bacterium]
MKRGFFINWIFLVGFLFMTCPAYCGEYYEFAAKWGGYGTGSGQFKSPEGIAIDNQGNLYVADTKNDRIQKFTRDGTFITKWESGYPRGVTTDMAGNVYVADTSNHRIQKFRKIELFSRIKRDVTVYPNPLKVYNHTKITFGDRSDSDKMLPEKGTIKIYNISRELIKTIEFNISDGGKKEWDVNNNEGKPLASGVYIYVITNPAGEKCIGKIGIVK